MTHEMSPTVTFLIQLRKIDKAGLTVRDILILYAIISRPGINGNDITKMVGKEDRSSLQSGFVRLIRSGYIEDRRERISKAVPTIFHATEAGCALWEDLKPQEVPA